MTTLAVAAGARAATIGLQNFGDYPPDGLRRPFEGSGRGGGADAHHDSRMARRRNRWRLECRAAARLVRAAHGQRVRQADDVPAVIVRALTSLAHEALALTASANAMDARASTSTRAGARPMPMRCGRQRIRSTPTHLRVQHRVQRGGAQRVRRHASAGGFFAGPNPRSQKAATMSSSSASIVCWLRSSSPRAGFALRMAAISRRHGLARGRSESRP